MHTNHSPFSEKEIKLASYKIKEIYIVSITYLSRGYIVSFFHIFFGFYVCLLNHYLIQSIGPSQPLEEYHVLM